MELTTLDQEKIQVLEEIAKLNMEFSNAKANLNEMKGSVQDFLNERNILDSKRLAKLLSESKEITNEIKSNYNEVHTYYNEVKSFSDFLNEFHEKIIETIHEFSGYANEFMESVKREQSNLADIRKKIEEKQKAIDSEKETIRLHRNELEKEKRVIESRQEQLKSALQVINKK